MCRISDQPPQPPQPRSFFVFRSFFDFPFEMVYTDYADPATVVHRRVSDFPSDSDGDREATRTAPKRKVLRRAKEKPREHHPVRRGWVVECEERARFLRLCVLSTIFYVDMYIKRTSCGGKRTRNEQKNRRHGTSVRKRARGASAGVFFLFPRRRGAVGGRKGKAATRVREIRIMAKLVFRVRH